MEPRRNRWNLMEARGTLWTLLRPPGAFHNLAEVHRTLCDILELLRTFRVLLGPPGALLCFFGEEPSKTFLHFQNLCRKMCEDLEKHISNHRKTFQDRWFFFSYLGEPCWALRCTAERSGAHITEPYDVFQNCVQPSWTSRNMWLMLF